VIVVNLLPHPHTVQIGCPRVLILQSYGLGPVHGKDTHLWPLIHSFVENFKNQYLKPERSLGRKIRQKQLNPWIFWPEELLSKSSVVVGNPDWVACNLSRRPVPCYHLFPITFIIGHINTLNWCCMCKREQFFW